MSSRARNKLTVRQVAAITRPGVHSDGGGLYLRVRPPSRHWIFIGTLLGRERTINKKTGKPKQNRIEIGLGSDLDVSLAQAREKAEVLRAMLLEGKDPRVERAKANRSNSTFGEFAMEMLDSIEDGFKNPKHRQQWRNTLTTYAQPMFDLPINAVETEHILAVLQPIWLEKSETASRVRGRIERVLDAAKVKGLRSGENPARLRGHLQHLLPDQRKKARVQHHAALPFAEVEKFMADLRSRPAIAARALEFTVLTAARSGEVRGMTWAEVDLEKRLWTVPASRMKASVEHEVPLSDAAIAILKVVQEEGLKPEDFVFPASRGGSLSDMSMSQLLKRMGRSGITVHGFRSTFRDWAGDATMFEREVVEMALAHAVASKVEAAYRRGRALEKRRELMNAWAEFCAPARTFGQIFSKQRGGLANR